MFGIGEKLKAFVERHLWGENLLNASKEDKAVQILQREPTPDELVLGWEEGEDEESGQLVRQLKGVPQHYRSTHFYIVGASGSDGSMRTTFSFKKSKSSEC